MVNAQQGILIECDPQMRQFLLHLDETAALGFKFIITNLDDTHIFIEEKALTQLMNQIDDLMDKTNFVEV
jgi:TFIIH basal transcription factor complex TTD-A subunit